MAAVVLFSPVGAGYDIASRNSVAMAPVSMDPTIKQMFRLGKQSGLQIRQEVDETLLPDHVEHDGEKDRAHDQV